VKKSLNSSAQEHLNVKTISTKARFLLPGLFYVKQDSFQIKNLIFGVKTVAYVDIN